MGPGIDWVALPRGARAPAAAFDAVVVRQPDHVRSMAPPAREEPVEVWRDWLAWHVVHAQAPYLSAAVVEENFDFYGRTLSGVPADARALEARRRPGRGVRSARPSGSSTSSGTSRRTPRSAWSSSSTTSSRPSGAACRRCRGWATTPGARRWTSSASSPRRSATPTAWRDYSALEIRPATCSATCAAPWRSRSTASSRSSAARSTATSGS